MVATSLILISRCFSLTNTGLSEIINVLHCFHIRRLFPFMLNNLRFVVDEKEMLTVVVFVVVVDVSSLVSELAFGNVSVVKILSADIGLSDIPTDETDLTGEFAGTPTTALALRPQTIFGALIKDKRRTWIPGFIFSLWLTTTECWDSASRDSIAINFLSDITERFL